MATDWPEARALALAAILPAGTDRYIALFDGNPIDGGTEISPTGYARIAFQDWATSAGVFESTRSNASLVTFGPFTDPSTVSHWAIYDSPVGGILLRSSEVRDNLGQAVVLNLTGANDEPQFPIGELMVKFEEGPAP